MTMMTTTMWTATLPSRTHVSAARPQRMGFTFTKTTWFRTPTLSCLVKKTFKEKARRGVQKEIYKGRPPELHRWLQSVILPGYVTSAVTDW